MYARVSECTRVQMYVGDSSQPWKSFLRNLLCLGNFIQSPLLAWNSPGRLGWLATEPSHPPASTPSTGERGTACAATLIFLFFKCVQVLLLERSGPADAVISRTVQLFLQSNCLCCCFRFLEVPSGSQAAFLGSTDTGFVAESS